MNNKYRVNTIEYYNERIDETFYLRELTATQLAKINKVFENSKDGNVDHLKLMGDMLHMALVDSEGNTLLSKKELSEMSGALFMELATQAGNMNNMGEEVVDPVEELSKND